MDTQKEILYKPGDLIMSREPWIYSLLPKFVKIACYQCMNIMPSLLRCSKCHFANYCNEKCQEMDWKPRHKDECKVLRWFLERKSFSEYTDIPGFDYFLFITKAIAKLRKGDQVDMDMYRKLRARTEETSRDKLVQELFLDWSPALKLLDPNSKFHSSISDFVELYSKIHFSNIIMQGWEGQVAPGLALYEPYDFVVGCDRNVTCHLKNRKSLTKATKNIYAGDRLIISPFSPFTSPKDRAARYAFLFVSVKCGCAACNIPAKDAERNAFKCGTPGCSKDIPLDERATIGCDGCGRINDDRIDEAKNCVESILKMVDMDNVTLRENDGRRPTITGWCISTLNSLIDWGEKILHPENFTLGLLYKTAAGTFQGAGMGLEAVRCMEKMILPMEVHIDPYFEEATKIMRRLLFHYAKMGETQLLLERISRYRQKKELFYAKDAEETQNFQKLEQKLYLQSETVRAAKHIAEKLGPAAEVAVEPGNMIRVSY